MLYTETSAKLKSKQQNRVATLLSIAQLGYAHWFFGNLYEAVVRVPERLAKDYEPGKDDRRLATVFSSRSPVRYYVPGDPGGDWCHAICGARRLEAAKGSPVACRACRKRTFGVHRDDLACAERKPQ